MLLHKEIADRLRAGALVVLVEESDELLAREAVIAATKPYQPVVFKSASDQDTLDEMEKHRATGGTLVLLDFLRAYGSNPVAVRLLRELALQQRKEGDTSPFSRVVLIEVPGVEVPASLRGDIEYLIPKLPGVKELRNELEDFVKQHDVKLEGNGEVKHRLASSVAGLARHEAARLFARSWVEKQRLDPAWLSREKAVRVSERSGGALSFIDLEDVPGVGGLAGLKAWLGQRKGSFGSEKAKKYGLPEPKGVLLLGIPGVGKSLTPKATALEWGLPLLRLDIGRVFASHVGESEAQIRQSVQAAEACAPCILWIDEIEKGIAHGGGDGGTSQRVFGTLLTWLQEKVKPVFVVATANRIEDLPPELLRKGRFDEIFFVDLPTAEERAEIVRIHLARRGRSPAKFNINQIVAATNDFGGAEIEQAIIEGMFTAYADGEREVTVADIVKAARGTKPLSTTMSEDIKRLRNWASGRAKSAALTVETTQEAVTRRPSIA